MRRPRRTAVAPTAATAAGLLLIGLAVVLGAVTLLSAPSQGPTAQPASSPTATWSAGPVPDPATGTAAVLGAATAGTEEGASPGLSGDATTAEDGADGTGSGQLVVHVAGAVASPGVVVLRAGARVIDAIDAAGGPSATADAGALNLARQVVDGERIRVPAAGDDTSAWQCAAGLTGSDGSSSGGAGGAAASESASSGAASGAAGSSGTADALININTADATALEELPGVGPATAAAIIAYREEHGPFAGVDDLLDVPGIGPAKLAALRERATT